jgi:hypothetical protein
MNGEQLQKVTWEAIVGWYEGNVHIVTCISDFRCGFGSVSRFTGCSPAGTTINFNVFNLIVTITLRNYEQ